jgi:threonine aldolase
VQPKALPSIGTPSVPTAAIAPFDFASDNAVGVDPRILRALSECNEGSTTAYGFDELSVRVNRIYSNLFEHETYVFAAPTGTAANGLAIGAITPAYGAVFCHEHAHIVTTECGAPEFYSCGARLVLLSGQGHKISAGTLSDALKPYQLGNLHRLRAATLSLTQLTDAGTSYSADELAGLTEIAHTAQMRVHLDGARFANAIVHRGLSPAEMSWKAGIDVLSFGLTKNGGMDVDAVICFDAEIASELRYLHKRAGFLYSKMRFAAAQLCAYATDGLWLENARRANSNARRLVAALLACSPIRREHEVHGNQVFVRIPAAIVRVLEERGFRVRPWADPAKDLFRLVGSYCDQEEKLTRFESALAALSAP